MVADNSGRARIFGTPEENQAFFRGPDRLSEQSSKTVLRVLARSDVTKYLGNPGQE